MKQETMDKVERLSRILEDLWAAMIELFSVTSPFIVLALCVYMAVS